MLRLQPLAAISFAAMLVLSACQEEATPTPTTAPPAPTATRAPLATTAPTSTTAPTAAATATRPATTPTSAATAAATSAATAVPTRPALQAPDMPKGHVVVTLKEANASGQSGKAVLTSIGDKTEVAVDVTAAAAGVSQPMHIHTGPCAQLGGVVYPLTNVSSGASTTTVDAKLDDLLNGNFAINVHKSTTESSVYTACGDLPKGSVVKVDAKNNSGQDGWVALSDSGGNTLVVIDVKPGAAGVAQPAHVHNGPCDRLGGVVHPLTNVSNGRSVSLIAAKVDALQTGTFAVNVHKSPQEASVYTACGDIPRVATFTLKGLGDAATAQPGQATLIGMGTSTRVIVQVKAGPRGTEQPIHIHNGPCDRLGGVVHSLTNVVNGRSTTDVAAPIATLLNGTFAINLHKSGAEASVYVACGDLTGAAPSGTPAATPSGTGSPAGASQQTIQNFRLPSFSVAAGSAVTWTNMDNDGHSVTSGTPPTKDGKFDSGEMRQNDKFSFTFTQPGEYPYFCVYHTSMTGKVTVTAGSSATGTVSPTSTRSASADPYEY